MVNELYQMINYLREPEFDSWMEQLLVKLYLPFNRTSDYQGSFPWRSDVYPTKYKDNFSQYRNVVWYNKNENM